MLRLTFLGTSAARPTVERAVPSIVIVRKGETLMFDCGEGTQRQMMRYRVSFGVSHIFFTHFHGDHYLGLTGLLRTLALEGRTEPMHLYGPAGVEGFLQTALKLEIDRLTFPIEIRELTPGERLERDEYDIEVIEVDHGEGAVGYTLREHRRLGQFKPEKARELGVPNGPLWGALHRGQSVQLPDGRTVDPAGVVGPSRPGRLVVLSGDTRPCESVVATAEGADLLVHEATFGEEEQERARETGHSTAIEAAQVAVAARVKRLALTHISARYSAAPGSLLDQACSVFPETVVAEDGMRIDVPYAEKD
jgi:ribonuclease Z